MFDHHEEPTAIRTHIGAVFVSLELSRKSWLVTSLSPGDGEKLSKRSIEGGDLCGLLALFAELKRQAQARMGVSYRLIVIQEAGLDGFWIHRALIKEGVESHVVDAASIAVARRRRRVKTDRIDGEALVRVLLAYKRGEPRVCAMVRPPTPEEEDRRRLMREREALVVERVRHVNRIKGLLFSQGVLDYKPLRADRRRRLDELRTGDGRALPENLKAQIARELDRVELLLKQIKAVEEERAALLRQAAAAVEGDKPAPVTMLLQIRGIGPQVAASLWSEGLCRSFSNRRRAAAYAGLAPTPWRSGAISREQGVSKSGNQRLRTLLIELSWLWLHHQPQSALSLWFKARATRKGARKTAIVALARKLFVALWKYVSAGVVVEGAILKEAA
jgi:transposase